MAAMLLTRPDVRGRRRARAKVLVCLLALGAPACRPSPGPADLCPPAPPPLGELRLTARCANAYRAPSPPRAQPPPLPIQAMAGLEARGEWGELAAVWLRHDDPEQAALALKKISQPAGRDGLESDLAAVAFARGDATDALERLDAVLERRPDHPQALWNRAVVLARMDPALPRLAAESFERVAALGEAGWAEDAKARAARLREESAAAEKKWRQAREASPPPAADPDQPLEQELKLGTQEVLEKGDYPGGSARLEQVLERCKERSPSLCLRALGVLSTGSVSANQLIRAEAQAREQAREARRQGDWEQETEALKELAQALRFSQVQSAPTLAILGEVLARSPGDGPTCSYVRRNLAAVHLRDLRFEAARREIDLALSDCHAPLLLNGASAIAELARVVHRPDDAANLAKAVADEDLEHKTPGRRNLGLLVQGRFQVLFDRAAGEALLRKAIASSEPLLETDASSRNAWSQAYQELALDAARRGEWPAMLKLVADRLLLRPAPKRCALAVQVHAERTAVAVLGADGALHGAYDASRRTPLGATLEGLVPPELLARLEGCDEVEVLTTSPLDTRSGLLPSKISWAYRGGTARAAGPARSRRQLVIADVDAPASLRLPRLSAWSAEGGAVTLTGAAATPARVLKAMTDATVIDIHAHGLINPLLSAATAIALAPERDGRYALTAELIRSQARLDGAPVVSLGACAAAWRPAFVQVTASLPQAFIDAGARAVLAATVEIPDASGAAFFSRVSERIQAGQAPAKALRDEREQALAKDPKAAWVESVLLYE